RALAGAGAAVVVVARTRTGIEAFATELRAAGRQAWAVPGDVTDPATVSALARAAETRLGHVDILVNNAGVAHSAPLAKLTLEDWNRVLTVNATGTFLCTQAFLPGMLERRWGRVVNIASVAGLRGGKYIAAYSAAKHAVVGFTRSLAAEVAGSGVTVNAVCPGYVDTDMTRESVARIATKTGMSPPDALRAALAAAGQRRLISPDEVARAVLGLCDDAQRDTNGEGVVIAEGGGDGGGGGPARGAGGGAAARPPGRGRARRRAGAGCARRGGGPGGGGGGVRRGRGIPGGGAGGGRGGGGGGGAGGTPADDISDREPRCTGTSQRLESRTAGVGRRAGAVRGRANRPRPRGAGRAVGGRARACAGGRARRRRGARARRSH